MTVRVLVVDDSATMRALITRKLEQEPDLEVVGTARDALEARQLIKALDPDVVTLDIEMPGMDGLSFLAKIMELRPTPVIVVSGSTGPGAQATVRAMQLGAINCYAKASASRSMVDDDGGELASLVREASHVRLRPRAAPSARVVTRKPAPNPARSASVSARGEPAVIAIGSSTGGVEALHSLLARFPADCPPTLIVQHVSGCFADAIASSLDRVAAPLVRLAQGGDLLQRGEVLLAPGDDAHLVLDPPRGAGSGRTRLKRADPVSGHRPSVDVLFNSVAKAAGSTAQGVILTGMGRDGASGLKAMADAGADTIAQDKESCVVFGMPRAAIEVGAAKITLPLDRIAVHIFAGSRQLTPSTH
ncbi:MAG: chemotaxis response regulator protein-glutamate methylesterase [Pseudomonadota bacterium]